MYSTHVEVPVAIIGGDHHIHAWSQSNYPTESGAGSRIDRSLASLQEAVNLARQYKTNRVILNGDLFHTKNSIHPIVLEETMRLLEQNSDIWFILNTGNHERPNKHSNRSTLSALDRLDNCTVIKKPVVFDIGLDAAFLPYYSDYASITERVEDLYACQYAASSSQGSVLIAHYPLFGADIGSIRLDSGPKIEQFRPELFDLLLFSDIHQRQQVAGTDNAIHLGATHANVFSEEKYTCGWWLLGVDTRKDVPAISALPTKIPGLRTVWSEEEKKKYESEGYVVKLALSEIVKQTQRQSDIAAGDVPKISYTGSLTNLISEYVRYNDDIPDSMKPGVMAKVTECFRGGQA